MFKDHKASIKAVIKGKPSRGIYRNYEVLETIWCEIKKMRNDKVIPLISNMVDWVVKRSDQNSYDEACLRQ